MKQIQSEIFSPRSIAEIILSSKISSLRRWLLKKLIPHELWGLPAIEIGKLQKGAVIGSVTINLADGSELSLGKMLQ